MPDKKESPKNSMNVKAVNCFWSVIAGLSKDIPSFTIYRARSFAYIGYKLISTKEDLNTSSPYSSLYNDDQFQRILKNPLSAFKYATDELPNDEVVLNRKGTSLWLMFKYRPAATEDENRKYLDDAAEILSFSITQNPPSSPSRFFNQNERLF
ncbi:PSMD8 [Mytilus edulis]|uniref:PSMD8 n=1 Tax=Mytilus edulis TaxID=6550 RepID=A0A8S3S1R8_MYTED|nr:PSMD8 [Mytilus edulis]